MYLPALRRVPLFLLLARIDADLAAEVRSAGCPRCSGPLHWARYLRKPRGGPGLPEELAVRQGLCCGDCRRRTLPPSVLFLGRRIYWGAVVTLVAAIRQHRPGSASAAQLRAMLGVSWRTVRRWVDWWATAFPHTAAWRAFRGYVGADVRDDQLPSALCLKVRRSGRLAELLIAWARSEHAVRGP